MKNRTNSLIYAVALLFTLSLGSACKNDKTASKAANQPPITVSAVKLLADFEKDQDAADKQYKGRLVHVSGEVLDVTTNHDNTSIVLLNSPESSIGSIQCLFGAEKVAQTAKLARQQQTVVKGVCEGMDDIGVSVVISSSTID